MKNWIKFIGLTLVAFVALSFTNIDKKVIVIDAGHGGEDSGVKTHSITEKEITLSIAQKIKKLNQNPDIEIILIRNEDHYIPLGERAKKINALKPNLVISLHANQHKNKTKKGKEIIINDKNQSKDLALKLKTQLKDANIITSNRLHLLRNVEFPVALIELGFLTNEEDKALLTSEAGQRQIAEMILKAIN
ncbi:MAG: N-acetylmuramoyl-L-alanine amidase [Flavobacteriales bacterium]|nr:MAG: N-acetylmuramoyl-L-alanine amidase [Flavobacteriales bacterium]